MSDSRSPHDPNKSDIPQNTSQTLASEKDEIQKKQKLDVPNETSSPSVEASTSSVNNSGVNKSQSASPISASTSKNQVPVEGMFVPRPVTAKRKSETNLTQPSASLSSSATVTSSSSSTPNSNSLISQLLRKH